MKTRLVPPTLSAVGLIIGAYAGVWVAGLVEKIYAPSASSSDNLDFVFVIAMLLSCLVGGLVFSFVGFKIGKRLVRTK
jgi:hypothetical protein